MNDRVSPDIVPLVSLARTIVEGSEPLSVAPQLLLFLPWLEEAVGLPTNIAENALPLLHHASPLHVVLLLAKRVAIVGDLGGGHVVHEIHLLAENLV